MSSIDAEKIYSLIAGGNTESVRRFRQEMVQDMMDRKKDVEDVVRAISFFNRNTENAVLDFFQQEYPWLEKCTFLEFGSGAREEQILTSDQDNGFFWQDPPEEYELEEVTQRIVLTLDSCGIRLCSGGVMVNNEKWRGDFHKWRKRLTKWLSTPKEEGEWQLGTIVDFAPVSGPLISEAEALRSELRRLIRDQPVILKNLGLEISEFKAPVTFWGGFVLEKEGELKGLLDVKHSILAHMTNAARLLCLKHDIEEVHTRRRIHLLGENRHIPAKMSRDLSELWKWVQERRIRANLKDPSRIKVGLNPYKLDKEEQNVLRKRLHSLDKFIFLVRRGSGL